MNGNIKESEKVLNGRVKEIPSIDKTLTKEGMCADAKATGDAIKRAIRDFAFPVGAIYMSTVLVDPAALFGGVWMRLKDRFLLGAGDRFKAGEEDGEAVVTLSENEIPYHHHEISYLVEGDGGISPDGDTLLGNTYGLKSGEVRSMRLAGMESGDAHNNMPPYLAVYMWVRKA